jgi:hypothetical protein
MASFQINARRPDGSQRSFHLECTSRAEADEAVRRLGWEPQAGPGPEAAPAQARGGDTDWTFLILGFGVLGLILGPLLPVVSVSAFGQQQGLNLWDLKGVWALTCVACGLAAAGLAFAGMWVRIGAAAAIAGGSLLFRLVMLSGKSDDFGRAVRSAMPADSASDPAAAAFIQAMSPQISLAWGWFVLFAAVIALFVAAWQGRNRG